MNDYIESMICSEFSSKPKKFYSFIKGRKTEDFGVSPLKQDGILHSDPKVKASILNKQFTSVFSEEDDTDLPSLGVSTQAEFTSIRVNPAGVCKLLQGLNPHKACGPPSSASHSPCSFKHL